MHMTSMTSMTSVLSPDTRILPEFQRHLGTHALPFKATDERQSLDISRHLDIFKWLTF